jgi:hypothetical protein
MCSHETTLHLLTECSYPEATWNLVATKFGLPHFNVMSLRGDTFLEQDLRKNKEKWWGSCSFFGGIYGRKEIIKFSEMLQDHQQCCSLSSKRTSIINTQSALLIRMLLSGSSSSLLLLLLEPRWCRVFFFASPSSLECFCCC